MGGLWAWSGGEKTLKKGWALSPSAPSPGACNNKYSCFLDLPYIIDFVLIGEASESFYLHLKLAWNGALAILMAMAYTGDRSCFCVCVFFFYEEEHQVTLVVILTLLCGSVNSPLSNQPGGKSQYPISRGGKHIRSRALSLPPLLRITAALSVRCPRGTCAVSFPGRGACPGSGLQSSRPGWGHCCLFPDSR